MNESMPNRSSDFGAFAANAKVGSKLGLRAGNQSAGDVFEQICQSQSCRGAVDSASVEQIAS
jgi:hypothetical protein